MSIDDEEPNLCVGESSLEISERSQEMKSNWDRIQEILASPEFAERIKALLPPRKTPRWKPREQPIVHQGTIEAGKRIPLCGSTREPVYLTDVPTGAERSGDLSNLSKGSWSAVRIARLGEAGKWHEVKATYKGTVRTACNIELAPIKSSVREVVVEHALGEPTCKHCLRLRMKGII